MNEIPRNLSDIGYMDTLASGDTSLHRLDARAKLLATGLFIAAVVSFNRYEVARLAPFALFPVFLISVGGLPPGYLLKKLLPAAPFALVVGIFNPLLDTAAMLQLGGVTVSAGWVSFFSIVARFVLTVSAALALVALTGVNAIGEGLAAMGAPRAFVTQLLFLNRYLFELAAEAGRMERARELRACGRRSAGLGVFAQLAGSLLLRGLDRAERVYQAMLCRGFDGSVRTSRPSGFGAKEVVFVLGWSALFALFRFVDMSQMLGKAVMK